MKHKILLEKLEKNGWNIKFNGREEALIKDIIKITKKESIPLDEPVRREIYDRLLYYCWCVRFEKDEDFMLTKTHDAYKEFLTQVEIHDGDCTLQAVSCMKCHLQACEIEAQKLYNYLYGK
jgi:hypothetical protein